MTSLAAWLLTACGVALIFIGGFFVALRPPLMPEDARFMGAPADAILGAVPALSDWLRRVFWVLGGYIASTGVLVVYVASTGVRTGSVAALVVIAIAGVMSIGWMSVVNFMIRSDFKWFLLGLDCLWVLGLALAAATR